MNTTLQSTGNIKCLGVLYDTDYSGDSQYAMSKGMMTTLVKVLAKKRASPAAVEAVIKSSLLNKAAYQGVLSNWSLDQTLQLDDIYARELKKRSKHMASHQGDNMFQPAEYMGMGFTRLAYLIQDRKRGLITRALRSDHFTRMAMEMLLARGAGPNNGSIITDLDGIVPGLWITSVQEYGARAGRVLRRGPLAPQVKNPSPALHSPLSDSMLISHATRKLCQLESIHSFGDLTDMTP